MPTKKKTESTETAQETMLSTPALRSSIVQPRISEKATKMAESNKYVFVVAKSANKIDVKKAIETAYKVKVQQVNIVNTMGKQKNSGKVAGKTSNFKKAIVTLRKGEKIGTEAAI